jgi:hypothetical protein
MVLPSAAFARKALLACSPNYRAFFPLLTPGYAIFVFALLLCAALRSVGRSCVSQQHAVDDACNTRVTACGSGRAVLRFMDFLFIVLVKRWAPAAAIFSPPRMPHCT